MLGPPFSATCRKSCFSNSIASCSIMVTKPASTNCPPLDCLPTTWRVKPGALSRASRANAKFFPASTLASPLEATAAQPRPPTPMPLPGPPWKPAPPASFSHENTPRCAWRTWRLLDALCGSSRSRDSFAKPSLPPCTRHEPSRFTPQRLTKGRVRSKSARRSSKAGDFGINDRGDEIRRGASRRAQAGDDGLDRVGGRGRQGGGVEALPQHFSLDEKSNPQLCWTHLTQVLRSHSRLHNSGMRPFQHVQQSSHCRTQMPAAF